MSGALLEVERLCFAAGEATRHEVSFALAAGAALQIDGPSGCGKSTLLQVLCRLAPRLAGVMRLAGVPAEQVAPWRWRRQVAYLDQRPVLLPGTVRENLAAPFATARAERQLDEARAAALLRELGLDAGALLERPASALSGGEASRVALCRALLVEPRVLLADEPAAALDDESAAALVARLQAWVGGGGALVLVVHDHERWRALPRARLALGGAGRAAPLAGGG